MSPLLLRAAIARGVLLVTANWPVILIDFAVGSFYRLALAFPVIGGALMVTVVAGIDVRRVLAHGIGAAADIVVGSLATAPAALAAFFCALALVAIGGQVVLFVVKAGTLSVLVHADRTAGEFHRSPLSLESWRRASAFRLEILVDAWRRFARRGVLLALWLGAVYALVAATYLALVTLSLFAMVSSRIPAWSAIVLVATSGAVVMVALANLAYTLLRVVIVTDDCQISVAVRRLCKFVVEDARQVIGIFSVIAGIELLAAAVSLFAAAGLAPIAYLPVASLVLVPVQIAIWLIRALLFEALSLSAVAAYQTQYRRFSEARWPSSPVEAGDSSTGREWLAEAAAGTGEPPAETRGTDRG